MIGPTRDEIDAAFAGMADDPDFAADVEALTEEFAVSDWEAFTLGEAMDQEAVQAPSATPP